MFTSVVLFAIAYFFTRFLYSLASKVIFEITAGYVIKVIATIAGVKLVRYFIHLGVSLLGLYVVHHLFVDRFISLVYSLVIDKLLRLPPEFTEWLAYFGVFDGLRLLEAVFIWVIMFKVTLWALKPPSLI